MHGNVYEWVMDRWHKNYNGAPSDGSVWEDGIDFRRVARGGGHRFGLYVESRCRSAYRQNQKSSYRTSSYGFRILRENNTETIPDNTKIISENVIETTPERITETVPKTITETAPKSITESIPQLTTEAASKIVIQKEPKIITKTAPKRITLSGALRWMFGIFYLLVGLMYVIEGKVISAGLAFLIGIILIPSKEDSVGGKNNYSISGPLRFVIVLVLAMLVGLFSF